MAPQSDTEKGPKKVDRGQILSEELATFSSRAGHDLVGPLNQSASLLALFVKRFGNQIGPDAEPLLEHLGNAAAKMDNLVSGLEKYLSVASSPLKIVRVDLQNALSSALALLESTVKASAAIIVAEPLPAVDYDREGMTAIFQILIDNAIKFRRAEEAPSIHVSARNGENEIVIAVADNGIGIDPKFYEDVCLPFKRLNGRVYPGAGLGLATVKLIARLHGGGVRIERSAGHGTTVRIIVRDHAGTN